MCKNATTHYKCKLPLFVKFACMSPQIITNKIGKKTGVILSFKDYKKLKEMAEELVDIKAYDKAKANLSKQKLIPLRNVIKERKQKNGNAK